MKKIQLFKEAEEKKIAIGQFNFSTISQLKGIVAAAKKLRKSFILGTSEGESEFLNLKVAASIRDAAEEELKLPIILNLDHGKSFEYVKRAIEAGYDMVHFDGSSLSFKENIKNTKTVVEFAKGKGVIVEGELGYLRGSSTIYKEAPKIKKEDMTLPDQAEEFIEKTGVNLLAVVIGNIHGISAKNPHLDLERLLMIKNKVGTKAFLVLHGGSGVPNGAIKESIKRGIRKININTEVRVAWRNGLENVLCSNKREVTPYKILPEVSKEIKKVVVDKINLFSNN